MAIHKLNIKEVKVLIKLLPEQLVKFWDMIRFAIAETFLPRNSCTNEHLRVILANLLSGKQQCWMGFKMVEGERKFVGFIITKVCTEQFLNERVVSIDHIYAFTGVTDEIWNTSVKVLQEYATKNQCMAIVGLTENERFVEKLRLKGIPARHYVYLEVTNG
jgi:hypothetical protein